MDMHDFIASTMAHAHAHGDASPAVDAIIQECAAHAIDPLMVVALCYVESGYNPLAVSGKGARGLMQLMPATAQQEAQEAGIPYDGPQDLFLPDINVRIGISYLARLYVHFGKTWALALTGYNRGPTATQHILDANDGKLPERVLQSYANLVLMRYYDLVKRWGVAAGAGGAC